MFITEPSPQSFEECWVAMDAEVAMMEIRVMK